MENSIEQDFSNYLQKNVKSIIAYQEEKIYFSPNIDKKKLNNARKKYADNVFEDAVIALHDNTVFGKSDDGFIITSNSLYYHEITSSPYMISFKHIKKVELNKDSKKSVVHVHLTNNKITLPTAMFKSEETFQFLNKVKSYYDTFNENSIELDADRILVLEEMNKKIQILYIKALVNFDIKDNGVLESGPLTEIMSLMTQLHFTPEMRHEIRSYISEPVGELNEAIYEVFRQAPKGNRENITMSLIKDIIRVLRSRDSKTKAVNSKLIMYVATTYSMNSSQVQLIEDIIVNDEKLIKGEISDSEFKRVFKDLTAKAGSVGVPIMAIYMSGSVVGLSAAGITSGLATLGLGGLLGFSSMVTGIGVLIIGGVVVYTGIKFVTGGSERKKKSKREKMIQEIVKNHQATINNLIDDIDYFTTKMNELSKNRKENELKLQKLQAEIRLFKEAMTKLKNIDEGFLTTV